MGARQKLNQAYFNGAAVVAAGIGLLTESWTVFWIALVALLALSLHGGEIRPGRRR